MHFCTGNTFMMHCQFFIGKDRTRHFNINDNFTEIETISRGKYLKTCKQISLQVN